jgi:hypothetical protein
MLLDSVFSLILHTKINSKTFRPNLIHEINFSSCSVESDWSDEEIEELEKMFGHIQVGGAVRGYVRSPTGMFF